MEAFPIDKIQVSGATLASLLHRSSAACGDIQGYLFGRAAVSTPNILSDHSTNAAVSSILITTITSFLSIPSHLPLPPPSALNDSTGVLLGWFSSRRKTPLRPSLKDSRTTSSLVSSPSLTFTPQNSNSALPPSLFLLITTPFHDQLIHTHEYKVFQYIGSRFEVKSLSIVNIGPSFRSQYDSFSPSVQLPMIDLEHNSMEENDSGQSLKSQKRLLTDQNQLDKCAEGLNISKLGSLISSESDNTLELEKMYDKMLAKIDSLSRMVEQTNARVLEQENRNLKQRYKVAGLE